MRDRLAATWRALARDRGRPALLALAAAHAAASLALSPGGRFEKYPELAGALARGALAPDEAADASPAYLLLTLLLGPAPLRWLQALAGAAAVVLVHGVARRARGPAAGWVAAVALAAAQPWLVYGAVLEPDLLIGALGLAAVAALAAFDPARLAPALLAGAALGLATALRPTGALLTLLALAWLASRARGAAAAPGARPPRVHLAALLAASALAALLPAAALGLRTGQDPRATMSAGQVFHQGHRPEGSGLGATFPVLLKLVEAQQPEGPARRPDEAHALYRRLASAAAGEPLAAPAAERYWIGEALAFAREEPAAFLRQLGRKLVFLAAAPGLDADVPDAVEPLLASRPFTLPQGWLALGGLAGLLLGLGRRGPARLLALPLLAYAAAGTLFYVQGRYAVTVAPALCALAGVAAAALWEARREPRRLAARGALALVPLLLLAPGFVRSERRLLERQLLVPVASSAEPLRRAGRQDEAVARYVEEQAAFPDEVLPLSRHGYGLDADAPALALRAAERARQRFGDERPADAYLLAVLYAAGARCDLALPLADRAAAAGFHGAVGDAALDPDLLASDCLLATGRPGEALARIRASLDRWPGTLDGLARAVAAGAARGDPGLDRWEAELFLLHDPASARYALSRARRRWGDAARALDEAARLAALLPEAAPLAAHERALALLDLGRPREALAAEAPALAVRGYLAGTRRFDAPFRALVAERPESRTVALVALAYWSRRGDLDEVRALLARHPGLAAGAAAP